MIHGDVLVQNPHCVYVRSTKNLFRFEGENISYELERRHENENDFTCDDSIIAALKKIRVLNLKAAARQHDLNFRVSKHVWCTTEQPGEFTTQRIKKMFVELNCRHLWIIFWTPNGYIGVIKISSCEQEGLFERFRNRLALAIDDENHYAAAAAWLSGNIQHDYGISACVAKKIKHMINRANSKTVQMVFDRETGKRIPSPFLPKGLAPFRSHAKMGSIVYELRHERPSPNMHWVFAHYAIPNTRVKRIVPGCWAVGRDADVNLAYTKAIAEATERYGSGTYDHLVSGSWNEIRDCAIDPRTLICFADRQYAKTQTIAPFDEKQKYKWTVGYLQNGEQKFILADLVYYPFDHGKTPYAYANSCGVAAHTSTSEAEERAIQELIERDAVMKIWHHRIVLSTISHDTIEREVRELVQKLEQDGFEIRFHWAHFSCLPTVFVSIVAKNPLQWPNFTCAAATDCSPASAIKRAMQEADASIRTMGSRPKKKMCIADVRHVSDHGVFAALPTNRNIYGEFFRQATETIPIPSLNQKKYQNLFHQLKTKAIFVDLSLTTIEPKLLSVLRAFLPGMIPMTFGSGLEPLGMLGMRRIPKKTHQDRVAFDKYRSFPHPFA